MPGRYLCSSTARALLLILLIAWSAGTPRNASALPRNPAATGGVRLVYDDSKLTDDSRAKLIEILAADAPREQWKKAAVAPDESTLAAFIEKTYAISRSENSKSFEALHRLIREANPSVPENLAPKSVLAIPPVPVRGAGAQSAALMNPARLAEQAWSSEKPVLPPGVHPIDNNGVVWVELLQAANDHLGEPCDGPAGWLTNSPFYAAMKARIENFKKNKDAFQYLLDKSKLIPLVVIDWSSESNPHGQKTYSAAKSVLASLGLTQFAVQFVDLNPKNDYQTLADIFSDYRTQFYCAQQGSTCGDDHEDAYTRAAEAWLKSPAPEGAAAAKGEIRVNQLVLESVLWKYFKNKRAWVDMPFTVDSRAVEMMQRDYFEDSESMGIAAADDRPGPESARGVPQRAAGVYRGFVNVTYGTQTGEIEGAYSDAENKLPVTVEAPGCGYEFEALQPSDRGTSLASAYVAAWAWLRNLMDNTAEYALRTFLMMSRWIPPTPQPLDIEGAGAFDPARLIVPHAPEVLGNDGAIIKMGDAMLTLRYKDDSGNEASRKLHYGDNRMGIAFLRIGGKIIARVQEFEPNGFPIARTYDLELTGLTFTASTYEGTPLSAADLQEFVAKYSEIYLY